MVQDSERSYLPAAGKDWALPFYDPLVKLLGGDTARRALLTQAAISPSDRILDIGCGTGTLLVLIKQVYPTTEVVGVDPDPKALSLAEKKAARSKISVRLDWGFSDQLPYSNGSFDRVFSSLMFHHLNPDDREATLREVRRVLKPGGSFQMLDFSSDTPHHHGLAHRIHSAHRLEDNSETRVLELMGKAGFAQSKKQAEARILLGLMRIAYYRGDTA